MLGGCKKVSQVSGEGRDSGGEGEEFRGEGEWLSSGGMWTSFFHILFSHLILFRASPPKNHAPIF